MFTIGTSSINQADFNQYLDKNHGNGRPVDIDVMLNDFYSLFKKKKLLEYKDSQLEKEYPEFKALVQEYHDGHTFI